MFSILNLILWTLVAPAVPPTCAGSFSYAQWGADSAIARGQGNGLDSPGNPLVLYEHGELQWALKLLYERTKNKTYFNYIKAGVDNIVDDNGKTGGRYKYVLSLISPHTYLEIFLSPHLAQPNLS